MRPHLTTLNCGLGRDSMLQGALERAGLRVAAEQARDAAALARIAQHRERVVVEPDGYTWTTPHDGPCRGCEFEAMTGKSCPLHGGTP